MFYIIFYLIAWIVGWIAYAVLQTGSLVQSLTLSQLVIGVGMFGLWNFTGHFLLSERVAESIGWVSNGFQKELGLVSLGIGISGILCYWFRSGFWWATAIPFSTFLLGAAIVHIVEMVKEKNFNPGNTIIVVPDILMPVTLIALLLING
jgi:hypothetical protein